MGLSHAADHYRAYPPFQAVTRAMERLFITSFMFDDRIGKDVYSSPFDPMAGGDIPEWEDVVVKKVDLSTRWT